ncbi:MAG: EF-hand domain-containing protein [Kofleriaceae bacterium]|nr:EF-hand domain-containing protein [Kofleriaceae bacterium]
MRESSRREVIAEREHEAPEIETEESHERFAGGRVPPVQSGFRDGGATASTLAYEEDANEKELKQKVSALVAKKFGGDYKKAFDHYDTDGDGGIGKGELVDMLSEAGIGNGLTRGVWANKIIEKLDGGGDKKVQWGEFETVFRARA